MSGADAIIVMPLFFLFAIAVAYALLALYVGLDISAHTCGECGKTLPSDEALSQHLEGHRAEAAGLSAYHQAETLKKAA